MLTVRASTSRNAAEPGFTSTDLTGNGTGQTVAEGSEVIVRLATIGKDGHRYLPRERVRARLVMAWDHRCHGEGRSHPYANACQPDWSIRRLMVAHGYYRVSSVGHHE